MCMHVRAAPAPTERGDARAPSETPAARARGYAQRSPVGTRRHSAMQSARVGASKRVVPRARCEQEED